MKVTNMNGYELDFEVAINLMDEEILRAIEGTADTEQEFFTAYEVAHAAKYGEEWELSKANPTW